MNPLKTTFEEKLMQNYADIVSDYRSGSKRGIEYHLNWIYVHDENMTPKKLKAMQIFAFAVNRFLKDEVKSLKKIKLRKHNTWKLQFNKDTKEYESKKGWNFQVIKKATPPSKLQKRMNRLKFDETPWDKLPERYKNMIRGEVLKYIHDMEYPAYSEIIDHECKIFYNKNYKNIVFKTDYHGKIKNN